MIPKVPLLVILVKLVDQIPFPSQPQKRGPGRPKTYPDRLMVKALLVMVIRRIYSASGLLAFLEQETVLTRKLRQLLTLPHWSQVKDIQILSNVSVWVEKLAKIPIQSWQVKQTLYQRTNFCNKLAGINSK